jgi:hypothetical protein
MRDLLHDAPCFRVSCRIQSGFERLPTAPCRRPGCKRRAGRCAGRRIHIEHHDLGQDVVVTIGPESLHQFDHHCAAITHFSYNLDLIIVERPDGALEPLDIVTSPVGTVARRSMPLHRLGRSSVMRYHSRAAKRRESGGGVRRSRFYLVSLAARCHDRPAQAKRQAGSVKWMIDGATVAQKRVCIVVDLGCSSA